MPSAEDAEGTSQYPGTEERTADSTVMVTFESLERGTLTRYLSPGESINLPADRVRVEALETEDKWICQFCGDVHDELEDHEEHVERMHYEELLEEAEEVQGS